MKMSRLPKLQPHVDPEMVISLCAVVEGLGYLRGLGRKVEDLDGNARIVLEGHATVVFLWWHKLPKKVLTTDAMGAFLDNLDESINGWKKIGLLVQV